MRGGGIMWIDEGRSGCQLAFRKITIQTLIGVLDLKGGYHTISEPLEGSRGSE